MMFRNGTFHNTDALTLMREMSADSVDLIVTDPPYKVVSGGQGADRKNGYFGSVIKGVHNGKIFKHQTIQPSDYMGDLFRVLKPGSHCYVMTNRVNLVATIQAGEAVGFHMHNILRWDKPNVNANRWYMIDCEFTVMFAKKPVRTINMPGSKQGFSCAVEGFKHHPTQKPIALMEHYILNSSNEGDLILDPFAGCGSTLVAAKRNGRRFVGFEIDPEYYNMGLVRVHNA